MKLRLIGLITTISIATVLPMYWLWSFIFKTSPIPVAPHYYHCVHHKWGGFETPCTTLPKPLAIIISVVFLLTILTAALRAANYRR